MPLIHNEHPPSAVLPVHLPKQSNSRLPVLDPIAKAPRPKSKSLQPCRCPHEGCGKIFSKRSNLKAHMRIHDGVLPYPCNFPGCNKRFRWKSSLKPHIKVHLASGEILPPDILNPTPITTPVAAPKPLPAPLPTLSVVEPPRQQEPPHMPISFRPSGGPLPSPSEMLSLPLDRLPSKEARIDAGSPITVTDTRTFDNRQFLPPNHAPAGLVDTRQGRYACPHAGCNLRFIRLSDMVEHERNTYHADRRPPVMRRLFGDSHVSEVRMSSNVDLNCNSALSSPIGSADGSDDTEVASLTLESSACTTEENIGFSRGGTEELWKTEIPLMEDPLDDAYLVFGNIKEGLGQWMMPPNEEGQSGHAGSEWMMSSNGAAAPPS